MKFAISKMIAVAFTFCWLAGAAAAQQKADPPQTPRKADGHPDLSGLWLGGAGGGGGAAAENAGGSGDDALAPSIFNARQTEGHSGVAGLINFERDNTIVRRMGSNKPMYKPEYWATIKNLDQNGNDSDPAGNCMPPGVPRVGPPAEIFQTDKEIAFLYVSQGAAAFPATYRVIPIDDRKHTNLEDLDGSWNGESIGHWEGDTLVIDTIGFNTSTWLDIEGYIHSENMHVIEKLTRNGNTLSWQATVDDPDMLLEPWVMNQRVLRLNPNPAAVIPESPPCSERDYAHAVTKEHH